MPRNDLRPWLRRLALGLPLVAAPPASLLLAGWGACGSCPPPAEVTYEIGAEDRGRVMPAGVVLQAECVALCNELERGVFPDGGSRGIDASPSGTSASWCGLRTTGDTTTLVCTYDISCGAGRRPAGLRAGNAAGWLARMAHLEAASVSAFEDVALELRMHGAPRALVEAARSAADDEVRHARDIAVLARARGAEPSPVVRGRAPRRSLAELVHDNRVEGCGREAEGALAAAALAARTEDPAMRSVFATIAREEAGHALLSFAIDAWAHRGRSATPSLS